MSLVKLGEQAQAALEKQCGLITKGLSDEEKSQIASTLRNYQKSENFIGVSLDGKVFEILDDILFSTFSIA